MSDVKQVQRSEANNEIAIDYEAKATKYLNMTGISISEKDVLTFFEICKEKRLNPFNREVYAIPYTNNRTGETNINIITGYEVYIKRANSTGLVGGWKAWTEGDLKTGTLKGCVRIVRKDYIEPFYMEVYFYEYNTKNSLWLTKPRTMIEKVAISQGFRRCFPEELGGMPYTKDEMNVITKIIKTDSGEIEIIDDSSEVTKEEGKSQLVDKTDKLKIQIMDLVKQKILTEPNKEYVYSAINDLNITEAKLLQIIQKLKKLPDLNSCKKNNNIGG